MRKTLAFLCFAISIPLASADQGGFTNSGGSLSSTTVANPPGTLSISGQNLSFVSNDGAIAIQATFTTSKTVENCSGGGKGGHVTCSYTFTGLFNGVLSSNGGTQAINGSTIQVYGATGGIDGSTGYNSTYTPFYFSNSGMLLRSDDLNGDNLITYGTQGSDVGQFYGANSIALDSAGRIYVADTYNGRVVRIDDMTGTNWTTYGTYGSDVGQFLDPLGISVDPSGRIYVMDTGNNRLVRIDDMNGTNWTTMSSVGSGVGQFQSFDSPVAFDTQGRIYVADGGNRRVVRMDDMNATNWTTLSQSPVINNNTYTFAYPGGISVTASGQIFVLDTMSFQPSVVRVDDMTGANWTTAYLGLNATPHSISVDSTGMVLVGGGGAKTVDNMLAVQDSGNSLTQFYGPYYVFGATLLPVSTPRPSAISFTPSTLTFSQNAGTTSPAQTIVIANFGGSPLNGPSIFASAPFAESDNCTGSLIPGAYCTASVTFTPAAAGTVAGTLTISDDSGNMGPWQVLSLSGTGTAPAVTATPTSLSFQSQVVGTTSVARNVTLQSTGTGPLQVTNIAVNGPFSQTNTCSGAIAPGSSCTVQVSFTPAALGSATGSVVITDNAGTQTVNLSGSGVAPVSVSPTSYNFESVAQGGSSSTHVTLTNRTSSAVNFAGIAISGAFAIASNTCGSSIAAGKSCTVGVTFSPAATGSATGSLTFTDDAPNSPQSVSLSGTGVAPVTLSTSSMNFGTVKVGTTSSSKSVTLTNHQSTALSFSSSIAVTAGFTISNNTCGGSVAAGANCSVSVKFSPAASGAASGTLTLTDSAANSPQVVMLSGTGQ